MWCVCRTTEIYDPFRDVWELGPLLPGLMAAPFSFAGGAATRTGVFVVGGATHSVSVARLDRKSRVWHPAGQPAVPRVHCAVAALPEQLLLLVSAISCTACAELYAAISQVCLAG